MFNSYEELKAAVESRRKSILTLEVDMGTKYSVEHEEAKKELAQAKGMKALMGGQQFLGDNMEALEQRVADTAPEPNNIYVQYKKLDLDEWTKLITKAGQNPVQQYESVLPQTFIGVFGVDPTAEDEEGNLINADVEPLTTDAATMSSRGNVGILPGGGLNSVIQAFMAWQNSGGDVNIRPTR